MEIVYRSKNGKEFSNEEDCQKHELMLDVLCNTRKIMSLGSDGNPVDILKWNCAYVFMFDSYDTRVKVRDYLISENIDNTGLYEPERVCEQNTVWIWSEKGGRFTPLDITTIDNLYHYTTAFRNKLDLS